jgi:benzoyl-CoA reductase subunit C
MFCPFCRDVLAQGLKGRYEYLNGIMIAQSCLHIRQSFGSWQMHVPTETSYYLPFPHGAQSPHAVQYLTDELDKFKKYVEEWTGKTITDNDLDRGIEIMNKNRQLMSQIYDLRKQENPPLTGSEAMKMVATSQMVDKEEHNKALEEFLVELQSRKLDRDPGVRLIILGSEDDDTEFIEMVEKCLVPATIVVDEHCTGTRYFWEDVEKSDDKLKAIATRYLERPACPSKDWVERRRTPHIMKLVKDWNVQGAILVDQKFCVPHGIDNPAIKKELEKNDIRTLYLEFDVLVPVGQFKTRVEAFLEMLQMKLQEELF